MKIEILSEQQEEPRRELEVGEFVTVTDPLSSTKRVIRFRIGNKVYGIDASGVFDYGVVGPYRNVRRVTELTVKEEV